MKESGRRADGIEAPLFLIMHCIGGHTQRIGDSVVYAAVSLSELHPGCADGCILLQLRRLTTCCSNRTADGVLGSGSNFQTQ